jgi:hypothetical protein
MVLKEYENLYPRKLFVAIVDCSKDLGRLAKTFTFFKIAAGLDVMWDGEATDILADSCNSASAFCAPVSRIDDGAAGVLCVVPYRNKLDIETIAHEAVHITDYFYETLNMDAQDYSDGNEPYAYLTGWAAENIHKTCCEYETKLRRVKASMGSRKNGPRRNKKRGVQSTDAES